ncbi:MAG: sigma 54-interacting transcriptional regulator [Rhizobiaceae bacterium]|nr:sigma 54-interacting transcriptional regulator [Rhizobiaceae bacterium]
MKGSFTGATSDRVGAAVSANGGTLFLDEICEMDLDLQSKLLRFLQTGTVQKVGSDKLEKIDVRIVCATNRNPLIEVEEGRFREDLYYRLHVVPIELPPLRARESDVIEIGLDLVKNYSKEEEKEFNSFTSDAEDALLNHNWPGNVRELQNVIRNAIILNDGEEIDASMLNFASRLPKSNGEGSTSSISAGVVERSANGNGLTMSIDLENAFADIEREIIEAAEMVKYVDNIWHATKVCFANEVGRICKPLDIDSHEVMNIFVQDTKLNLSPYYLKPGFAYGGSCLPKEVRAVAHLGEELGVDLPLVNSLAKTNEEQIQSAVDLVKKTGKRKIGFLGLAFKAGTDDLRESPILEVIASLLKEGYDVKTHDPAIGKDTAIKGQFNYVRNVCPHLEQLIDELPDMMTDDCGSLVDDCDVVVVTQKNANFQMQVGARLHNKQVIDLVRLFDELPKTQSYEGIGW